MRPRKRPLDGNSQSSELFDLIQESHSIKRRAHKRPLNGNSPLCDLFDLIQESTSISVLSSKVDCEYQNLCAYLGSLVHYHVLTTVPDKDHPKIFTALSEEKDIKVDATLFKYVKDKLAELRGLVLRDQLKTISDVKSSFKSHGDLGESLSQFIAKYNNLRLASFLYGSKTSNGLRSVKKLESEQAINATLRLQKPSNLANPNSVEPNNYSFESNVYLKSLKFFNQACDAHTRLFCENKPTGYAQKVISHQNILDMYPTEEIDNLIFAIEASLRKSRDTLVTFLQLHNIDDYCVSIWQGIILKSHALTLLYNELQSRAEVNIPTVP